MSRADREDRDAMMYEYTVLMYTCRNDRLLWRQNDGRYLPRARPEIRPKNRPGIVDASPGKAGPAERQYLAGRRERIGSRETRRPAGDGLASGGIFQEFRRILDEPADRPRPHGSSSRDGQTASRNAPGNAPFRRSGLIQVIMRKSDRSNRVAHYRNPIQVRSL